jgi:hypothetical protein
MHRQLATSCFIALLTASAASAQDPSTAPDQSRQREVGFMTSYTFHLNAAHFATSDERFTWDSDLGGDIDLVDYGSGRLNFFANYKAILGEEFRQFDLNQGSYTLDFRATLRSANNEVAAVFHHVSRHLSDRPRPFPIDWNMMGIEYFQRFGFRRTGLELTGRMLVGIERSFVDYQYEFGGQFVAEHPIQPRVMAFGSGALTLVGVDRDVFDRGMQNGGRLEGGIQVRGEAGVVELFLAVERRIDAHPLDHQARTWALAGFRLLNR